MTAQVPFRPEYHGSAIAETLGVSMREYGNVVRREGDVLISDVLTQRQLETAVASADHAGWNAKAEALKTQPSLAERVVALEARLEALVK